MKSIHLRKPHDLHHIKSSQGKQGGKKIAYKIHMQIDEDRKVQPKYARLSLGWKEENQVFVEHREGVRSLHGEMQFYNQIEKFPDLEQQPRQEEYVHSPS